MTFTRAEASYVCMRIGTLMLCLAGLLGAADLPPADLNRVQVGSQAPEFTLEKRGGGRVTLSQYRGQKRVVLVFYRGQW